MKKLKRFLYSISPGNITDDDLEAVRSILKECWYEFQGSTDTKMEAGKLGRMEEVKWSSPVLKFNVERHGGAARGSSSAEIQGWVVDLDQGIADQQIVKKRLIGPRQTRLDVGPIANELAMLVTAGERDPRLKWANDGRKVRVLVSEILPSTSAVKQTLAGRRKRLREALKKRLEPDGWNEVATWSFERHPDCV